MKKFLFVAAAVLLALVGCEPKQKVSDETEMAAYTDSTMLLIFNMDVELPIASDEVSSSVRRDLLEVYIENLSKFGYDEAAIDKMYGVSDSLDIETLVAQLGNDVFESLSALAEDDAEERASDWDEDLDMDFEDHYDFQWECLTSLKRVLDADSYWVYLSEDYEYLGGAHGGVSGAGYLTYSKADGSRVTGFIDDSQLDQMQDVLRQGIIDYFAECGQEISEDEVAEYLFIEDGIIPLPALDPYPSEDGLCFVYQQYEIAPYAVGMPAFTVPFSEIKPYLTDSAKKALDL